MAQALQQGPSPQKNYMKHYLAVVDVYHAKSHGCKSMLRFLSANAQIELRVRLN